MAQQVQTFAVTAPGFYGLNTQDSSLDLAAGFALVAKDRKSTRLNSSH